MKILMASHSPDNPNGGASRVFHLLAGGLEDLGHDVTLLHLEDLPVPRQRHARLLAERLAMPQLLSRGAQARDPLGYDVVLSASGMAYPLFKKLRPLANRPLLVNLVHGLYMYDHAAYMSESLLGHWKVSAQYRAVSGPIQVRWDAQGIRWADKTVVQNLRDVSQAREMRADWNDIVMIPPAIHPELLAASESVADVATRSPATLLWFGTWEARKGAHHLPAAFRAVRAEHPEATLTMGGTGQSQQQLRGLFAPEDRESVTVLPRLSVAEQIAIFNTSSIFLFPSLSEGFGLALAEAMCFGLAAVTTSTAFGGDFLHDGESARVVHPSSAHLSRAVIELLDDPDRRVAIAQRGREIARSFTVARSAGGYERLFLESIAERPVRRERGAR